jgi:transposase
MKIIQCYENEFIRLKDVVTELYLNGENVYQISKVLNKGSSTIKNWLND